MNKKILSLILALLMAASAIAAFTSCNQPEEVEGDETGSSSDTEEVTGYYEFDLAPYVTLGQYKDIAYVPGTVEVTDDELDAEIASILAANTETVNVEGRGAQIGDTLNIDYIGRIGGIPFEGGTASAQEIVLGSSGYIPGFDDGLLGAAPGQEVVLDLVFPDDYHNADYAGRQCEFTVTVNTVTIDILPELNDEFVASVSECATVDEYREQVRADLLAAEQETERVSKINAVWEIVKGNATVIGYPQQELDRYVAQMNEYYTEYAANYSMTLEDFCANYMGLTLEEYNEQCQQYAKEALNEELVLYAIIHAENISLTDEEYAEGLEKYAESYGIDTQTMEDTYGKAMIEQSVLWDKTLEFLADNAAVITAGSAADETTAAESETAAE